MAEAFRKEYMQPTGRNVSEPGRHEIADEDYDVISVIYHCLQGCETAKKYERDARDAGDNDLADYFHQVQRMNLELANRGRQFLKDWVNRESVSEASSQAGKSNVEMMPKRGTASRFMGDDVVGGEASRDAGPIASAGDTASSGEASRQVSDTDRSEGERPDRSQAV